MPPNHEVASSEFIPEPGDILSLDRVAERTSDRVRRLDREKVLAAVADRLDIGEVSESLDARTAELMSVTVSKLVTFPE